MAQTHAVAAALVAEALRGDRDAFGALVVRYFSAAYAVALAHLGHHESAQDAVQYASVAAAGETGTAGLRIVADKFTDASFVRVVQRNAQGPTHVTALYSSDGVYEAANLLAGPATLELASPDGLVIAERAVTLEDGELMVQSLP